MNYEFLDFDLRFEADGGGYRAVVVRSPAGESHARTDTSATLAQVSESIRGLVENPAGRSRREIEVSGVGDKNAVSPAPLVPSSSCGLELFDLLLPNEVRSAYRTSLAIARRDNKRLRLRLRFEAPELAALPWEFAFDDADKSYVGLSPDTPIVRYLEIDRPPQTLTIAPPLRILGMIAAPNDQAHLDVAQEQQQMERAVRRRADEGGIELQWVQGQTWRDLQDAMRKGPWHVLHFIGHGGFDSETGVGLIALVNDAGNSQMLSADDLARLLIPYSIRLVVLNACETARASPTSRFSSTGSILIRNGVPAVVSMQFRITDAAALEFSRAFYSALVDGAPVDAAVSEARTAVKIAGSDALHGIDTLEWGTPVLYMHSPDGRLFNIDMPSAIFPKNTPGPVPSIGQPGVPPAGVVSNLDEGMRRNLLTLGRRVKEFWVDGVLNHSLFRAALIDLGMESMEGAVTSPWATGATVFDDPKGTAEQLPAGKTITDVFADSAASLLVLGEPGSGKTTTALRLVGDLIEKAQREGITRCPVVFNLSSWSNLDQSIEEWLLGELRDKYSVPTKVGRACLQAGGLLPILDGLDEVSAVRRSACVAAINAFAENAWSSGAVVCCRLKEYIALPVRLRLNAAVQLHSLNRDQVLSYVRAAGVRLEALAHVLGRDPEFLDEAASPLMLNLMIRAYSDLQLEQISSEGTATAAERRTKLMDAYVARMFRRVSGVQA